jgi:hypothetical protein
MRACIRLDSRTVTDRPVEDLFMRLDRERRDADRAYNDALSAVDRAIQAPPRVPPAPRPYDDQQVTPINRAWNILPDGAPRIDRSIRGRLRAFIWRIVGPPLETQKQFNAAVVDHINRNVPGHREVQQTLAAVIDVIRGEFEALVRFE